MRVFTTLNNPYFHILLYTLDNKVENKFSAVNSWKLSSSSELKLSAVSNWDVWLISGWRFLVLRRVKHRLPFLLSSSLSFIELQKGKNRCQWCHINQPSEIFAFSLLHPGESIFTGSNKSSSFHRDWNNNFARTLSNRFPSTNCASAIRFDRTLTR